MIKLFLRKALYSVSSLALISVLTTDGTAFAQETNDDAIPLDQLIIYGAKETNTLNDTAASVGVVTDKDISEGQIRSFRDAFRRLGNVMDADFNDAGFIIRGLSSEGFVPGGAPLASFYIDGVLQTTDGTRRGARGLWDVEQVEVYRGPQSTQSGRAATAGAIHIKTKDPTFEKEGAVSTTIGTDSLIGTALMLNVPIVDNQVAVRFAGAYERSNSDLNFPTFEAFNRFDDLSTDRYYNMRGKVLIQPHALPKTAFLLSYSFAHDAPVTNDIGDGPGFGLKDDRGDFNIPLFTEARAADVHNAGMEITHNISDNLLFTSLTGLTNSITQRPSVNEGTNGQVNFLSGEQDDLLTTQELRLNYDGDRVNWVGGLYGSYQHLDTIFDRTIGIRNLNDQRFLTRKTLNAAAFGEFTYEFAPSWKATAGGRLDYTKQKSDLLSLRRAPLNAAPITRQDIKPKIKEVVFVPKLGLSKDFGDTQTVGVTYTEGFRTGGFDFNSSANAVTFFDPEKAESLEFFYKGRLLDNRLTLNANVFHTKYTDQQIELRLDPADPFSRVITNAASSRSIGFEFEPSFQVTERFSTFASIGYVNTKFLEFDADRFGDLSGQAFPEAPEWTLGIGGHYAFDNGFYVGGDAKFTPSYFARLGTPPRDRLASRTVVNLQAGYRKGRWEVNAFTENAFDERYFTFFDEAAGKKFATLGARQKFGVNVKVNF